MKNVTSLFIGPGGREFAGFWFYMLFFCATSSRRNHWEIA